MAVPNIFGTATSAIPLSQLDQNFATAITLGNTAVYLGNTTTSLGNVTLTNVTISSGTSNIAANVSTAVGLLLEANGGTGTTTGYNGFKNRIINGAMVIDQRNAGASVSPVATGYTLDRWAAVMNATGAKYSVQQTPSATESGFATRVGAGFQSYLAVTSLSAYTVGAGEIMAIQQAIEGFNVADLAWGTANAKTVTLSFWVYSSLTGTFGGAIRQGSGARSYPYSYTISAANTWEQKTITIAGDTSGTYASGNTAGLLISWGLGVGSTFSGTAGAWSGSNLVSATGATSVVGTNGATFYITGVQLEKGSTATSFDYRPYGTEMLLCQRYYWRTGGSQFGGAFMPILMGLGVNTTALSFVIQNPVRFRVGASSINVGGSAVTFAPVPASVTTGLTIDRASFDQTLFYVLGTGMVAGTAYRINGNGDATTFIEFLGMEL